ncbi:hypothetical protein J1614_000413 [Plenodomus biglobosus]|nr:hypothetical protein J1614_000413 [Plenodomus biglobosus]
MPNRKSKCLALCLLQRGHAVGNALEPKLRHSNDVGIDERRQSGLNISRTLATLKGQTPPSMYRPWKAYIECYILTSHVSRHVQVCPGRYMRLFSLPKLIQNLKNPKLPSGDVDSDCCTSMVDLALNCRMSLTQTC